MPSGLHNPLVVALAYDGLCTFEFGLAVEVFGLARPEMGPGWYRFAVAGERAGPLRAAGGVTVTAEAGLDLLAQAGTVVVPGWRGIEAAVPDAVCAALRAAHGRGARVMSLCSGIVVLAAAGLLDGQRCTTHWRYAAALAARFPALRVDPAVLYVDGGSVLTAAGSAAGLDLCLHLVRRDFGAEAANSVARRLVVPPQREGGQAQFIPRPVPPRPGTRLAPLLDAMRATLAEEWPLERMAAEGALSLRSLHRRFQETTGMAPGAWLLAERLARAQELLETTGLPMEDVAMQAGFGTAATLRLHFRARTGTSPTAWRGRFGRRAA
ncbi:MAG: transcriptional regulator FtrA [Roseomonas sp.]|nr:transcriptional regulator FtrA [Roseomonas sp.]